MKKLALVLVALAMLVCLCACDGLVGAKPEKYGTLLDYLERGWYGEALTYVEDAATNGTFPNGDADAPEGPLAEKYRELVDLLDAGDLDGAYCYVLQAYHHCPEIEMIRTSKWGITKEVEEIIIRGWHTIALESEVATEVTINLDGTCVIGDKTYYWMVHGASGNASLMLPELKLYDGVNPDYRINFTFPDTPEIIVMHLQDIPQTVFAIYMQDKQPLPDAEGVWRNPNDQPGYVQEIVFKDGEFTLDGIPYQLEHFQIDLSVNEQGSGVAASYFMKDANGEDFGQFVVTSVDGRVTAELLLNNGNRMYYYCTEEDFSQAQKELYYERATWLLEELSDGDSTVIPAWYYHAFEPDYSMPVEPLTAQEALTWAYDMLTACDGYADSGELLARFILTDSLQVVDNNGNVVSAYTYDAQGRVVTAMDQALMWEFYLTSQGDSKDLFTYTYAENGNIACITHTRGGEVVATITPSYNEIGISRLAVETVQGTFSVVYSYGYPHGVLEDMSYDMEVFEQYFWRVFFRDETFAVVDEIGVCWEGEYAKTYTYDDAGRLIGETIQILGDGEWAEARTYIYDDAGKLIQVVVIGTHLPNGHMTLDYQYGVLYSYQWEN